jgi:Helix-turn-helix domain
MDRNNKERTPLAVSKRDAAAMLGISVRSVENYLAVKRLVARKIGRRTVVMVSSLQSFLRSDQPSASGIRQRRNPPARPSDE